MKRRERPQVRRLSESCIDYARAMTESYLAHMNDSPAIREMACIRSVFPEYLPYLTYEDDFAGRCIEIDALGFLPLDMTPKKRGQIGYYMDIGNMQELQKAYPHRRDEIEEMILFWAKEATTVKIRETAPKDLYEYYRNFSTPFLDQYGYNRKGKPGLPLGSGVISSSYDTRVAGLMPNFPAFLPGGIPGLYVRIADGEAKNGRKDFYTAARDAVDLMTEILEMYRLEAEVLAEAAENDRDRNNMQDIARMCKKLQTAPPSTYREALQLVILVTIVVHSENYGRLDVALGDFLAHDVDTGVLTEEEAILETVKLFRWMAMPENGQPYDTRVLIGGLGRPNEKNADRFALAAIEAARRRHDVIPVLTLRYYEKQDRRLFDAAITAISENCSSPFLYNDDVLVSAYQKSMNLSYEEALDYAPLGCGEIIVAGKGIGSPNSTIRMLKALEAALHNGRCGVSGELVGIETGELSTLDTYEKLENAFLRQLDERIKIDVRVHRHQAEAANKEVALVFASLFTDDCIARGKALLDGGVSVFGSNLEGFGLTNSANSLRVIQKYVYEEKKYTLEELVHMLDVDFEGYEDERQAFLAVEKYGNDCEAVDAIKRRIEDYLNPRATAYGIAGGFRYCTIANVNPGGIILGPATGASADGRHVGDTFALGNSPHPGTDISGLTAALMSSAKSAPENGGYVTNLHLSRELMPNSMEAVKTLLLTYFKLGGQEMNINCFSKGDLEDALVHPENHKNLIVRVSGYSARYIDLDPPTQKHILARTVY